MITKKTIVDQIEITRTGHVQVRVGLLLLEDDIEIDCKWHRTAIEPGGDIDAQIAAVNAHLVQMDKTPLPEAEIVKIRAQAKASWTPQILQAHRATQAKATLDP